MTSAIVSVERGSSFSRLFGVYMCERVLKERTGRLDMENAHYFVQVFAQFLTKKLLGLFEKLSLYILGFKFQFS
jgi:hypothetical protein